MKIEKAAAKNAIVKHFFDFFMLFLAVSLGFIVDNYRDNSNSMKLAKELASDMVDDLRADTAAINVMLIHCDHKKVRLDSLAVLLGDEVSTLDDSLIYIYTAYVNKRPWFERHNSTTSLLLNAGYLSNFSKQASVSITNYDLECQKLIALLELEQQTLNDKIVPFLQQIFQTENFVSIINTHSFIVKPVLHNWTPENRWLFNNFIVELKILNNNISLYYVHLQKEALLTVEVLTNEYMTK